MISLTTKLNITKLTERNAKGKLVEYHIIDYDRSKLLKEQIFECPYTKRHFLFNDGILLGTILPSECFIQSFSLFCYKDANVEYKLQKFEFDDFEKNCNTCLLLERIKTEDKSLKGRCSILETKNNHPYKIGDYFNIYPSENMKIYNQDCYISRHNIKEGRLIIDNLKVLT